MLVVVGSSRCSRSVGGYICCSSRLDNWQRAWHLRSGSTVHQQCHDGCIGKLHTRYSWILKQHFLARTSVSSLAYYGECNCNGCLLLQITMSVNRVNQVNRCCMYYAVNQCLIHEQWSGMQLTYYFVLHRSLGRVSANRIFKPCPACESNRWTGRSYFRS